MHSLTKIFLRFWLAAASVVAFAAGWASLAHTQSAASASNQAPAASEVQLEPVPSLDEVLESRGQSSPATQPTVRFNLPVIRTHGS